MKPEALGVPLPDLSARILGDTLVKDFGVSYDSFCAHHRLRPVASWLDTADLIAEEELHQQHAFARATRHMPQHWLDLGARYRAVIYGAPGLAMMTSRTLADALRFATRYQALSYSLIGYDFFCDTDDACALIGSNRAVPAEFHAFAQYRDLGAIRRLVADLVGGEAPVELVKVAAAAPPEWSTLQRTFPFPVQFDAERAEWHFRRGAGALPLPFADRELAAVYVARCDRLLQCPGAAPIPVAHRLAALFAVSADRLPTAAEAATRLALSERTLHRRLAEEGTRFSSLVDDARFRYACDFLTGSLSIEGVAAACGFSELTSFSRAFKRWAGIGPGTWRRRLADAAAAHH